MSAALLLGAVAAFGEAMLGLGLILPGEVMVSGIAAGVSGVAATTALLFLVAFGACCGDHVNYALGRGLGERLPRTRVVRKIGLHHWTRGTRLVQRHGTWAIVISRLMPGIRTLMPAIAGTSGLRYPKFAVASVVGSLLWAGLWVVAGSAVAGLLTRPDVLLPVLAGAAVIYLAVRLWRRRRPRALGGVRSASDTPTTDLAGT